MKTKEAMQQLALMGFTCDEEPIYTKGTKDGYKFEDPKEIEKAIKEVEKSGHPNMQYLMALKRALELAKAERSTKDDDATEHGSVEEYGQNKETESMPVEKDPTLAQDAGSLVGKNVWVRSKGQEYRVYVLQDKGGKLYIHDPYNGTQGWISRSDVTGLAGTGTKDDKFGTVMKEFYEGKLKSSSGEKVTDPQQAKAIAYSETKDSALEELELRLAQLQHERNVDESVGGYKSDSRLDKQIEQLKKQIKELKEKKATNDSMEILKLVGIQ